MFTAHDIGISIDSPTPPIEERPRERLWHRGVNALGDEELLALVLGIGTRDRSARAIADDVVRQVGGMHAVSRASPRELASVHGVGAANAARISAAFELGRRVIGTEPHRDVMKSAADLWHMLWPRLSNLQQEVFFVVGLDARNHILDVIEISRGTLATVDAHPREVFRPLVRISAAAGVVVHNHPSGDPHPSQEDIALTRRLRAAGDLMGVPIVDHVIIATGGFRSMAEWLGLDL